jgi:hypothetical protein
MNSIESMDVFVGAPTSAAPGPGPVGPMLDGRAQAPLSPAGPAVNPMAVFGAMGFNVPSFVMVMRTDLSIEEIMRRFREISPEPGQGLRKLDNGRYLAEQGPMAVLYIDGAEADDVDEGVILGGLRDRMTPQFIEKLGSGDNDGLRAALSDVDTSAPIWAGIDLASAPFVPGLKHIAGSFDPRGKGQGQAVVRFNNSKTAEEFATGMEQAFRGGGRGAAPFPMPNEFEVDQSGKDVEMTFGGFGDGGLVGTMVTAMIKAQKQAKATVSMANLHAVGRAAQMYAAENEGEFPPSLDVLVEGDYLAAESLVHPASGHAPPRLVRGKLLGEIDYVYTPGLLHHDFGMLLLAYERPELAADDGVAVLSAHGFVERVPMAEFRTRLRDTTEKLREREERDSETEGRMREREERLREMESRRRPTTRPAAPAR